MRERPSRLALFLLVATLSQLAACECVSVPRKDIEPPLAFLSVSFLNEQGALVDLHVEKGQTVQVSKGAPILCSVLRKR